MLAILTAGVTGLTATSSAAQDRPYEALICSYDWDCAKAYRVMLCESTGNPLATNGAQAGLFQVDMRYHSQRLLPGETLYDADANVRIAHELWQAESWTPWPICGLR